MSSAEYVVAFLSRITTPSLAQFDDRLKVQKLVYLAEEMGADFGFTFGWYAKGPYSPSLTRSVFSIANEDGSFNIEPRKLSQSDKLLLEKMVSFLGKKKDDVSYLELVASVWYFLPQGNLAEKDRSAVIDFIHYEKPQFEKNEISSVIDDILKFRNTL